MAAVPSNEKSETEPASDLWMGREGEEEGPRRSGARWRRGLAEWEGKIRDRGGVGDFSLAAQWLGHNTAAHVKET
jgi:hypothetical protein